MNIEPAPIPRISLPSSERISDGERRRRRTLFERTMQLRDEIGRIDVPTYELVRDRCDG
jgi:hypothetical protein